MSTDIIIDDKKMLLIKSFSDKKKEYYENSNKEFIEYKNQPTRLKILRKKYPYLKYVKKNTKDISNFKASFMDILEFYKEDYNNEEKKILIEHICNKIKGLYKHAQTFKTSICNLRIINGFSKDNTICACVTKNTLEANEQWLTRLLKNLDKRYPLIKLNDKIIIISSKKNDLDGNATHCKNVKDAIYLLTKKNNFKLIFICSNKIRLTDIYEIGLRLLTQKIELNILHDEAHNSKEGIPAYRDIIENILLLENVISYTPITASLGHIVNEKNPLWIKSNLEKKAINYTDYDKCKSDSPDYSSIKDYIKIKLEEYYENDNWNKDYQIKAVSVDNFIRVDDKYKNKQHENLTEDDLTDIEHRRQFEFVKMPGINKENEAINNGLNILNLNNILEGEDLFIKNKLNIHIISTPLRKVLTQELCLKAVKKDYNPIVLGIYGNQGEKYHLFTKDIYDKCVDEIMGEGEFNSKLWKLIKNLREQGYDTEKPLIIIGNYTPTGESLSFVNYEYGIIRSVSRLVSTNAEEDYQSACRGCFMKQLFIENNNNWECPPKYLIGPDSFILNAEAYEIENDIRIDEFEKRNNNSTNNCLIIPTESIRVNNNNNIFTAIPIKVIVDCGDQNYSKLIDIANKTRRSSDEKNEFMRLLKASCDDEESDFEIIDKTQKFNWEMNLIDFRCYRKDNKKTKGTWKFINYNDNFETGMPFINNTGGHTTNQCEILVCKDKYILKNEKSVIIETNPKNVWWIGYKY